jgi:hypothetical protein
MDLEVIDIPTPCRPRSVDRLGWFEASAKITKGKETGGT